MPIVRIPEPIGVLIVYGAFVGSIVAVFWGLLGAAKGWPLRVVYDYTLRGRSARVLHLLSATIGAAVIFRIAVAIVLH
jgi:uncharacterized membrane protein YeaQ/YmgE (transglycosylase-associated protein family)